MNNNLTEKELLKKWLRRAKRRQLAHRLAAKKKQNYHLWVGLPAAIISAIVGIFAFSAFESQNKFFLIGTLSLVVSILTALQTFLKFDLKSKEHQNADIGYGQIRHDIEEALTFQEFVSKKDIKLKCEQIKLKIENVNNHSPLIPESIWSAATKLTPRME